MNSGVITQIGRPTVSLVAHFAGKRLNRETRGAITSMAQQITSMAQPITGVAQQISMAQQITGIAQLITGTA